MGFLVRQGRPLPYQGSALPNSVKAEVRVAFTSEGRAQPIPKSIRALMKADLV
jgi:hypothetical protein